MGKQWKAGSKLQGAQKKGAIFTKLAREIQVAARMGGDDPSMNARLKLAITQAQKASVPKETIERAIKKGAGILDGDTQIDELTYEGYGPFGVGIIVECQSNNKTRTVSEIRHIFNKNGGNMGETGAVSWMFERVSLIEGNKSSVADPEEEAIEVSANEVEKSEDGTYSFFGPPEDLDAIRTALVARGWEISTSELSYKAKELAQITDEQKTEVIKLLDALEDYEDSHRVHVTIG
jgi:YebC/PmpR family DNA-binding regulatory protein